MLHFYGDWRAGSTYIRGQQVAEQLQVPFTHIRTNNYEINPLDKQNDVAIFIKGPVANWATGYVDVLDNPAVWQWITPNMGVIAFTEPSQQWLQRYLHRSDIHLIPQHHCNFENAIRTRHEIQRIGYVGRPSGLIPFSFEVWRTMFAEVGFEFVWLETNHHVRRNHVADFYRDIDIQIFARQFRYSGWRFKDGLKVVCAGSYKVPSVALSDMSLYLHKEHSIQTETPEQIIAKCVYLRDNPGLYAELAERAFLFAQQYHIDKIKPLYLALDR